MKLYFLGLGEAGKECRFLRFAWISMRCSSVAFSLLWARWLISAIELSLSLTQLPYQDLPNHVNLWALQILVTLLTTTVEVVTYVHGHKSYGFFSEVVYQAATLNICAFLSLFTVVIQAVPQCPGTASIGSKRFWPEPTRISVFSNLKDHNDNNLGPAVSLTSWPRILWADIPHN